MARKTTTTTSAVEILRRRLIKGDPKKAAQLRKAHANQKIAAEIFELRTSYGLSQRELAKRIGTTASVICRLEDGDYGGHSLTMLRRIADAVGKDVEVRFVDRALQPT